MDIKFLLFVFHLCVCTNKKLRIKKVINMESRNNRKTKVLRIPLRIVIVKNEPYRVVHFRGVYPIEYILKLTSHIFLYLR